jgi:hypothetical protein
MRNIIHIGLAAFSFLLRGSRIRRVPVYLYIYHNTAMFESTRGFNERQIRAEDNIQIDTIRHALVLVSGIRDTEDECRDINVQHSFSAVLRP